MSDQSMPGTFYAGRLMGLMLACGTLAAPVYARPDLAVDRATYPMVIETESAVLTDGAFHPSQVLVRVANGVKEAEMHAAFAKARVAEVLTKYDIVPGLYCVSVPAGTVDAAIAQLSRDKAIVYAERDYYRFAMAQTTPYGIDQVRAPQTWAAGSRGSGVRVAVLDTGVDLTHPDLPQPVVSASFISGQAVQDNNNHGTHCSGTVLGIDNSEGVVGVAPQATLMIGKVLANSGSGATSGIISGIQWAQQNGARVISMSLGGTGFDQSFSDACQAAVTAGVVVVAAAGNSNSSTPSYPGAYDSVICVAANDTNKNRASFSNFGPHVDISAPGVSVLSSISTTTTTSTAEWNNVLRTVTPLTGSGTGVVTAQAVYCGTGAVSTDFVNVSGKIAHIRRGPDAQGNAVTFQTKTNNAIAAGAIGVIISNNVSGSFSGTLNQSVSVPAIAVSQASGDELQAADPALVTTISITAGASQYAYFNGTSMATPHVAGVAALLLASTGSATPTVAQVREAIETTAEDLGAVGRDDLFGNGLINAEAARAKLLQLVAPARCSPADIAFGDGEPLPPVGVAGGFNPVGADGGDFDCFFNAYFSAVPANAVCDIAYGDGEPLPPFGAPGGFNPGVDGGDFDCFFNFYFAGCL